MNGHSVDIISLLYKQTVFTFHSYFALYVSVQPLFSFLSSLLSKPSHRTILLTIVYSHTLLCGQNSDGLWFLLGFLLAIVEQNSFCHCRVFLLCWELWTAVLL